jgi:hypothetical protein
MVIFEFSRRDVEALARKLDSLQHELSAHERELLVRVFAAAKSRVVVIQTEGSDGQEPTLADLKELILEAFLPTDGDELMFGLTDRIGGEPFPV